MGNAPDAIQHGALERYVESTKTQKATTADYSCGASDTAADHPD